MNAKVKPMRVCRRNVDIPAVGRWRIVVRNPSVNFAIMRLVNRHGELLLIDRGRDVRYYERDVHNMWWVVGNAFSDEMNRVVL